MLHKVNLPVNSFKVLEIAPNKQLCFFFSISIPGIVRSTIYWPRVWYYSDRRIHMLPFYLLTAIPVSKKRQKEYWCLMQMIKSYKLLICLQIGDNQFCKHSYLLVTVLFFFLWLFSPYRGANRDEQMEMTSESTIKHREGQSSNIYCHHLSENIRGIKILILYHILVTKIVTSTSNGIKWISSSDTSNNESKKRCKHNHFQYCLK